MRDENGLYYYPEPSDRNTRVYVKSGESGEVLFRLWEKDRPEVWERHHWLSYDILMAASAMYRSDHPDAKPLALYDMNVARVLLKDEDECPHAETP